MKEKFDKNIFGLIANSSLHNMITIYINTFLVAYILNVSSGNFFNVALYYVIAYIMMIVSYTFFSFLICKINKLLVMRISIICSGIMLALMAILQSSIVDYLVLISLVYNFSSGMYWSATNSLSNELVRGKKLQNYNTYSSVVASITSIVVPIVFGSIIDSSSLFVISVFATIVGLLQIVCTFFFNKPGQQHRKFDLKGYYNTCYNAGHKKCFKLLFFGYFIYGIKDGMSVLITILIVLSFKTNTSLGAISSLISCLTIALLIFTNKKHGSKIAPSFLLVTGITLISMICLIIDINKVFIIFFNICYSTLLAIINRAYAVKRSGLIRAVEKKDYIVEHQAITELCLNIGRTLFFLILLFASFTNDIWVYKTLLLISTGFITLYGIFGYIFEKEYEKILIEREFKKQIAQMIEDHEYIVPTYSNQHLHNAVILDSYKR